MEILLPYIPGRSEASRRAKFKQITKPPLYMCVGGGGIGGGGGFPKTGLTKPPSPSIPEATIWPKNTRTWTMQILAV